MALNLFADIRKLWKPKNSGTSDEGFVKPEMGYALGMPNLSYMRDIRLMATIMATPEYLYILDSSDRVLSVEHRTDATFDISITRTPHS